MADRTKREDIIVVGAGMIGLAVAYELLRRGRSVVVLERDQPGAGATHAAGGMLGPTSEADLEEQTLIDFALDSLRRYPLFVAELEALTGVRCGLRTEGTLWVALDRDHDAELDHLLAMQRAKGLTSRRLTAAELFEMEPHLSGRAIGGLLVQDDHQVDPRALTAALVAAIERLGGRLLLGRTVRAVEPAGIGVRVEGIADGESFAVEGAAAVLAAGAWSTTDIRSPLDGLAVRPVKGQMVHLRGPRLIDHVLRTPDAYLVPREDGELLVGSTMEEQGFDDQPTAGAVLNLLRRAWEALPGIDDLHVTEIDAGLRPALRDNLPVIGRSACDGIYLALGHFRNGILLAPATAQELAELIVTGEERPALAHFQAARVLTQVAGGAG